MKHMKACTALSFGPLCTAFVLQPLKVPLLLKTQLQANEDLPFVTPLTKHRQKVLRTTTRQSVTAFAQNDASADVFYYSGTQDPDTTGAVEEHKNKPVYLEVPYFLNIAHPVMREEELLFTGLSHQVAKKKLQEADVSSKKRPSHKEGIFSPLVYVMKGILGQSNFNQVRGKMISLHSDVIKSFVATADTQFGAAVLRILFGAADSNKNGKLEFEELQDVLKVLRFKWLKEKQAKKIFKRAGGEEKGYIELEQWMIEAPKTLKTNLVKLAKANGGELGFLV